MRGDRLKQLRESRGMTQEDLATLLDTQKNQVMRWERGKAEPRLDALIKMANTFNVTTDYLLGLVDNPEQVITESNLTPDERELLMYMRNGFLDKALRAFMWVMDKAERKGRNDASES